jgi:hypothetical protein
VLKLARVPLRLSGVRPVFYDQLHDAGTLQSRRR